MEINNSAALSQFAEEVQVEYARMLMQARSDLENVKGMDTVSSILLERFCFVFACLRNMERNFEGTEIGRYNQLTQIWVKIAGELLDKLHKVFAAGAINAVFVSKIMTIVAEEVTEEEVLTRIRSRIANAAKEEVPAA